MKIKFILIALLFVSQTLTAKNSNFYYECVLLITKPSLYNSLQSKVLVQLKLKKKDIQEELYVEKIMPNNKLQTIVVIPKIATKEIDEYGHLYLVTDIYVLIIDNKTGKIKSKFFEADSLTSDAVVLNSIEIDTGLYKLNETTRAFAIRVNYTGSSGPNPYHQTDLSMFVEKGQKLNRIIDKFPISEFHGEWDTNCAGEFEEIESTIDIDNQQTNSFNNLIISQKIKKTINIKVNDDCEEKETKTEKKYMMKFNKSNYINQ